MEKAFVKNAADESQVKEADYKAKRGRERELDDVRYVLSNVQGRRFLWRYIKECGIFQTSFTGVANTTFFREGEKNVGLRMMADINESEPEMWITMMKENKEIKDV